MSYPKTTWRCHRTYANCSKPFEYARYHYDFNNFTAVLCQKHLNTWLDNADDDPNLEPTRLEFIS